MSRALIALFGLSACASTDPIRDDKAVNFTWFSGCWQTDDLSIKEVWSDSEYPYQFGYALTYDQNKTVFFETMRLQLKPDLKLFVYPNGNGPTVFTGQSNARNQIVFTNLENDYPQVITYTRTPDRLIATIAQADGSKLQRFDYGRCALQ